MLHLVIAFKLFDRNFFFSILSRSLYRKPVCIQQLVFKKLIQRLLKISFQKYLLPMYIAGYKLLNIFLKTEQNLKRTVENCGFSPRNICDINYNTFNLKKKVSYYNVQFLSMFYRDLPSNLKTRMLKCYLFSILLYVMVA